MKSKITKRRQYKPIGFGDPYDPRSVDGHRDSVRERAEGRRYTRDTTSTYKSANPSKMLTFWTFLGHLLRRDMAWMLGQRK